MNIKSHPIIENITLVPFEQSLVQDIAAIHLESLPEDFLPSLGINFLTNFFYPSVLASQSANIFVLADRGNPVGFVIIALNSNDLLKDIIKYDTILFIKFIIKKAFSSIDNFLQTLWISFSSFNSLQYKDYGEIYIIAVKEKYRGLGLGKILVFKSINFLKTNRSPGIKIKTLANNKEWVRFFTKNNWVKISENRIYKNKYVTLAYPFQ